MDDFFGLDSHSEHPIKRAERRGQERLLAEDILPKEISRHELKADYEELGIVFGEDVGALFVEALLPDGWTKQPSGFSPYWSHLADEEGRARVILFYKSTGHDNRAFMRIETEY